MDKLLIGRYLPGDSLIHRLDPRTKLLASFYFIGIVFFANNWQSYLLMLAVTLATVRLSRIKISFFLRGLRPMIFLIIFTVAIQIFFSQGGTVYWQWGWLALTSKGLLNGAFIFARFILIIFISTLLTLTTPPLSIADAIESLLKPLKYLKVPVVDLALILQIALRFVPALMDQTTKIMNAQRARGVDFGSGGLIKRIKAVVPLLIPLFADSFNIAEELATAMDARGYQGGEGRTKFRVLHYDKRDAVVVVALALVTILLLVIRA